MILIGESGIGLKPRAGELATVPDDEEIAQPRAAMHSRLACGGQGGGHPVHQLGPDEHAAVADPGHVEPVRVHAEGVQHVVEHRLGVGHVVVARGPVAAVLQVAAVAGGVDRGARGVAGAVPGQAV